MKYGYTTLAISERGLKGSKNIDEINLNRHINDVTTFIEYIDTKNIVLVGHSYSGFVATLAANDIPENISELIFIEAFLPRDGVNGWFF